VHRGGHITSTLASLGDIAGIHVSNVKGNGECVRGMGGEQGAESQLI